MPDETEQKKLDLIAQLLAKAESTTPEEAEALTEHAERLMLKYGIDQARIDDRRARLGRTTEPIVERDGVLRGVYHRETLELATGIANGLNTVRCLVVERPTYSRYWFVGHESDVAQAELLFASLQLQAAAAMSTWWRAVRVEYSGDSEHFKRKTRAGYLRGFSLGVHDRIERNRRTIVEDAGSGTELVLASRLGRIDDHIGDLPTKKSRPLDAAVAVAVMQGQRDGANARTGERPMQAGQPAAALAARR